MQAYYADDLCSIFHGDCREIMPTIDKVDLVLTDPPYGMNYRSKQRQFRHTKIAGDEELQVDLIWLSIAMAMRAAYVFCRWDNLPQMPPPKSVIAWVKNNWTAGDCFHAHGRMWEACCFYPRQNHQFVRRIPDVITCAKTGNLLHPTQKPVELIGTILAANVFASVLDPFMGSGTTLVAAKTLGRHAIGIELEERYCETAAKRLSEISGN